MGGNVARKISIESLSTLGLPKTTMERGTGVSTGGGELDVADLAGAAIHMGEVPWAAFMYIYRHDESVMVMARLRAWLLVKAVNLAINEGWPKPQRNKPETKYLQRLGELVLLEAKTPSQAGKPAARAAWWGVDIETWNNVWAKRYESLWERFKSLESTARIHLSAHANADLENADFSEDNGACSPAVSR